MAICPYYRHPGNCESGCSRLCRRNASVALTAWIHRDLVLILKRLQSRADRERCHNEGAPDYTCSFVRLFFSAGSKKIRQGKSEDEETPKPPEKTG